MYSIVLLRHGESEWNKQNLFTGWTDVPLSEQGIIEAQEAGNRLKMHNFQFDQAYVSVLKRSLQTLWYVMEVLDQLWIPWEKSWRLNERHYGALQGLNKQHTTEIYGEVQVHQWRRGFKIKPPQLKKTDKRYPGRLRMYNNLSEEELPLGESLEDTVNRCLPYWHNEIIPSLKGGKRIIIVAHGNSLRALVKHLDDISDDEISSLEISTGRPVIYELDENFRALNNYYL